VVKDNESGWMGTKDAASYLGITLRTLYRVIDEGQLPAYRFGRVIRVKRADVDGFVDSARIKPGELAHLYPAVADGVPADGER
jgi:excisionase family DNA binding protein